MRTLSVGGAGWRFLPSRSPDETLIGPRSSSAGPRSTAVRRQSTTVPRQSSGTGGRDDGADRRGDRTQPTGAGDPGGGTYPGYRHKAAYPATSSVINHKR